MHAPIPDPAARPQSSAGDPTAHPAAPTGEPAAPATDQVASPAAEQPFHAGTAPSVAPADVAPADGVAGRDGVVQPGVPGQTSPTFAETAGAPHAAAALAPGSAPASDSGLMPGAAPDPGCGPHVNALLEQRPVWPTVLPPAAPERGPRPATVRVALILQYVVVGMLALAAGLLLWYAVGYDALITEAAEVPGALQWQADEERVTNWVFGGGAVALIVLLAGWQLTNGLLTRRGNNVARILGLVGLAVPVVLGALVLCGGAVFLAEIATTGYAVSEDPGDPFAEEPFPGDVEGGSPDPGDYYHQDAFYTRLYDLAAERNTVAFDVGMPMLAIVATFLMIAAFVLLVVPASNRWFRQRHEQPRGWAPAFAPPQPPFPMPQPFPAQTFPVPPFAPQPPYPAPHQPPYGPPRQFPPQQQFPVLPYPVAPQQQVAVPQPPFTPHQRQVPPQEQFPTQPPFAPQQQFPVPPGDGPQS